jgi:sporulation protein YlmC with PRC-barrel domain
MTTTPAAPAPQAGRTSTLHLSELLRRPVTDRGGESIGRLSDVIVRLRGAENPLVTGLVATVGGREVYVPIEQVGSLSGQDVKLTSAKLDLRQFERREGEVLLRADVLGHRLIDVESAHLIKAGDLELEQRGRDWVVAGVDTHRQSRWLFGSREHGEHTFREWNKFEPLIGHTGSALLRGPFGRIRRLKPAQIADLIEDASKEEETEILGQVHADPELEADVFEELDEDLASRLLGARTDSEIAEVLTRMRADDAADAIAELPQRRRQPVLDLLPTGQRTKVLTLMGFNPASAGGLMGVDFLGVACDASVREALDADARSATLQPEALTS